MMSQTPRPPYISRNRARIGRPPVNIVGEQIRQATQYLRNHMGPGQVFTYSGPITYIGSSHYNPDYDYYDEYGEYPEFAVILPAPPKTDTGQTYRQLAGVMLPQRVVPELSPFGWIEKPAFVTWKHLYDSVTCERSLHRSSVNFPLDPDDATGYEPIDTGGHIKLYDHQTRNIIIDANMSYSNIINWTAYNGATLSKNTGTYHSAPQSLKVTCTGTQDPYAVPSVSLTPNADYIISGWYCGDGTAEPEIKCGPSQTLYGGTSSTTWQHFSTRFTAAAEDLRFIAETTTATQFCCFDDISVNEVGSFRYEPDADGEFTVGFLKYDRIRCAALSIFHAPDRNFTDTQAIVTEENIADGRAIRGYTGTGVGSLGDLEYMAGKGGADYSIDDVERMTRRCLIGSGHPRGLSTNESSYYNIRGGNASYFKVTPRNLLGKTTGNDVSSIPCCYGWGYGISAGSPAYVKYTALTSGDTWEYEITSSDAALWGDMTTLDINATGDFVKIEVKVTEGTSMVLKSYSLWEDSYDS